MPDQCGNGCPFIGKHGDIVDRMPDDTCSAEEQGKKQKCFFHFYLVVWGVCNSFSIAGSAVSFAASAAPVAPALSSSLTTSM